MRPSGQGSRRRRPSPRAERSGPEPVRPQPRRRKSLGQHHLKDGRICRPLIDFLQIAPGDVVVEIGPGGGVLTRELLVTQARVVAVELDLAWAFDLPNRAPGFPFREAEESGDPARGRDQSQSQSQGKDKGKGFHGRERRKAESGRGGVGVGAGRDPSEIETLARRRSGTARAAPVGSETALPFNESLSASRGLSSRFPATGLAVVVADALEIEWERLPSGWRVAGNLPYNVGTAIVERFLRGALPGTRGGFLLQREVVERIVAGPGDEAYGALSVLVALRARATRLGVVKPGAFVPPPKVDSAFVGLEAVEPPVEGAQLESVERAVRAAFGQRRKSLLNALSAVYGRERTREVLETLGLDPKVRAERLRIDSFVRLASELELVSQSPRRRGGSSS